MRVSAGGVALCRVDGPSDTFFRVEAPYSFSNVARRYNILGDTMKLTNECGLPDAIYNAVANDPYDRGLADYSITGLLSPPRKVALEREHSEEITEDAADRIWSLIGQIAHGILERSEREAIAERRLYATVLGKRISGSMDRVLLADGLLQDYKVTTVWKFKDGVPEEFVQQLNCYAWLLANGEDKHGVAAATRITSAEIVAILRDWSKPQAARDMGYPRRQCIKLPVVLWEDSAQLRFIEERIALHEAARVCLPLCSDKERWASTPIYAIMKQGAKKAIKLFDDQFVAEANCASLNMAGKGVYNVVTRPGQNKRCDNYCSVADFCNQYKGLKQSE